MVQRADPKSEERRHDHPPSCGGARHQTGGRLSLRSQGNPESQQNGGVRQREVHHTGGAAALPGQLCPEPRSRRIGWNLRIACRQTACRTWHQACVWEEHRWMRTVSVSTESIAVV